MVSFSTALTAILLSSVGQQSALLEFSGNWCPSCRAMQTTIQALEAKGYPIQKINIDQRPDLAAQYGVQRVPCYVMLVGGKEVDRVVGGTSYSRLERMFQLASAGNSAKAVAISPPPADPAGLPSRSFPPRSPEPGAPLAANPELLTAVPPADGNADRDARLLAASVRLRVADPSGYSNGSGTIIDSRQGEALILTCGHIFRDSQGQGRIEVDLFGPHQGQRVEGILVSYDLKSDVGLVRIRAPGPVTVTPLAPASWTPQIGQAVVSVGCDNGADPTVRHSQITSIDRYQTPEGVRRPANLEVAGQPTEGRSGGGLFTSDGRVIGVCFAGDPQDQEGLYAAPGAIQTLLDEAGLGFVYQTPAAGETPGDGGSGPLLAADRASLPPEETPLPGPTGPAGPSVMPTSFAATTAETSAINPTEQAALDEIRRHLKEGAEVVCVIRPRNNPQARSEVIMLDKASPEFLRQLTAEARSQRGKHLTSLDVARPRKKILEWSASSDRSGWQPAE
ncbi:MAG: trypsin-like peptidase domain-containing protein [Pirellulales bacterium]|nr:trypsin-like peptidase domain-containing protein [Pirellulales bacterium]